VSPKSAARQAKLVFAIVPGETKSAVVAGKVMKKVETIHSEPVLVQPVVAPVLESEDLAPAV